MAMLEQEGTDSLGNGGPVLSQPRVRWPQILAISIFWFAANFHWNSLGLVILPSQVGRMVGPLYKGEALAFVLIPGAFVSLLVNPLFGLLSDQMRGKWAAWGKRRPFILIGTLVNIAGLAWMAFAPDLVSLMLAYAVVQFSGNAAQAPFHALLPDIVPPEQRGFVSGIMGLLLTLGSVAGVLVAGLLVNAQLPLPQYQRGLWLTYGVIMAVIFAFMLITIISVRERNGLLAQTEAREIRLEKRVGTSGRPQWLTRSFITTALGTILAILLVWGIMNALTVVNIHLSTNVQQMVLELIAAFGLLRLFDFNPRRNPDFAWVIGTRFFMIMAITTIQNFLQFYMKDVVGVKDPEGQTAQFVILLSFASLFSAFAAGWLSDRFGRKRMIYISGGLMCLVALIFIVNHSLPIVLTAGAIFGFGYGAYISVDWALVADVLPSQNNFARDMGIWNISIALPQVIAPVIGGPIVDTFVRNGQPVFGYQLLFVLAIVYGILGTVTVRYIRGVKK